MKITKIAVGGRKEVCPTEVIMLKGDVNYTKVFLCDGKIFIVAKTLKELSERFEDHHFFRTHKSFLINLDHVKSFEEDTFLKMTNQHSVTVARRKKNLLKEAIRLNFVEK